MTEAAKPRRKAVRIKIRPELKTDEKDALDRHWRGLFLNRLAETSNVSEAARTAGVNPSRAYKIRRFDPDFAQQWHLALLEGYEHLEMETLDRLRAGVGKDGPKFDITNALRLLALHKDSIARQRALREYDEEDAILATLDARIEQMRAREMAAARLLLSDTEGATHAAGAY